MSARRIIKSPRIQRQRGPLKNFARGRMSFGITSVRPDSAKLGDLAMSVRNKVEASKPARIFNQSGLTLPIVHFNVGGKSILWANIEAKNFKLTHTPESLLKISATVLRDAQAFMNMVKVRGNTRFPFVFDPAVGLFAFTESTELHHQVIAESFGILKDKGMTGQEPAKLLVRGMLKIDPEVDTEGKITYIVITVFALDEKADADEEAIRSAAVKFLQALRKLPVSDKAQIFIMHSTLRSAQKCLGEMGLHNRPVSGLLKNF